MQYCATSSAQNCNFTQSWSLLADITRSHARLKFPKPNGTVPKIWSFGSMPKRQPEAKPGAPSGAESVAPSSKVTKSVAPSSRVAESLAPSPSSASVDPSSQVKKKCPEQEKDCGCYCEDGVFKVLPSEAPPSSGLVRCICTLCGPSGKDGKRHCVIRVDSELAMRFNGSNTCFDCSGHG